MTSFGQMNLKVHQSMNRNGVFKSEMAVISVRTCVAGEIMNWNGTQIGQRMPFCPMEAS